MNFQYKGHNRNQQIGTKKSIIFIFNYDKYNLGDGIQIALNTNRNKKRFRRLEVYTQET